MNEHEVLDVFDLNYQWSGCETKEVIHEKGLWHHTFHCWIVRKKGLKNQILFQKRAMNKKDSPGYFDISAAGHLLAGESKEEGIREVEEELGLIVPIEELLYLGMRIAAYQVNNIKNCEFCQVYLLEDNRELTEYKLQTEEVEGLLALDIQDGLRLFSGKVDYIQGNYLKRGEKVGIVEISVSLSDFLPRIDGYYAKILELSDRYYKNMEHLYI